VVGLEGVGHHGVSPALATIGRSCRGIFVEYEGKFFRGTAHRHTTGFDPHIERYMKRWRSNYFVNNTNVFILEDQSFPTGSWLRTSTAYEKKSAASYNLEWMHDHAQRAGVQMKFLHLTRDFYRTVASHVEFDGWNHCDVDFICDVLHKTLHPATARAINATQLAYTQSLPAIHCRIPDLDVSSERIYNFSQWVSPREMSKFVRKVSTTQGVERYENVLERSLEGRLSVASTVSTSGTDMRRKPRLGGR
jgi:hypothetical protein